jgi:hypothetical protein
MHPEGAECQVWLKAMLEGIAGNLERQTGVSSKKS